MTDMILLKILSSVLLPAPFAPITVVMQPGFAWKLTPLSAFTESNSVTRFEILSIKHQVLNYLQDYQNDLNMLL